MKTNKLFALSLLFALLGVTSLKSQELTQQNEKSFAVYPSFGLGIGFFYPNDVNDYIAADITAGYTDTYNTDLYMYLEVKGGVTFRIKKADFSLMAEYDIAPKWVVVTNGDNMTYAFSRIAPEISGNYYFPNKSGKNAFFIGGGISYSFLTFEDFAGSAPGFKVQAGYSMQFGKFNLQPYAAFRYSKAVDDGSLWGNLTYASEFELNYTGGQIGVILSFHPRILYK